MAVTVYIRTPIGKQMYYGAKTKLHQLARSMRRNPTEAENILWKQLKKFRKTGYVFRRQHPIDLFIADFYCHKIKLVIEIDGEIHSVQTIKEHDDNRTGELERFGIKVIRFTNEMVLKHTSSVLSQIEAMLNEYHNST